MDLTGRMASHKRDGQVPMWNRLRNTSYLACQMRGQARFPFRTLSALRHSQTRRVKAMVEHAYRTVPYYRTTMDRLGLRVEDFRCAEDLARLPLIEPEQLQQDGRSFVSAAQPLESYFRLRSTGSTGNPRSVYYPAEGVLQNAAQGERERCIIASFVGRRFGYRETAIGSRMCTGLELQALTHSHALLPSGLRIRRQYILLEDPPEKNVPLINEFRPDVIQSYGSYLGVLFSYVADKAVGFHLPKVVTYSSDGLADPARRLIQDRFGIPVFSTYQAVEALKIGFECQCHLGLHLNIDLYPLRVVDPSGRDLPPGQTGEVVVSNLVNRGTVLLNYRLGDLAALLPQPCPCGRTLPLLSFLPGRSDDFVELPSKQVVHADLLRTVFTREEQARQFQVVQNSILDFTVNVVAAPTADRSALRERLLKKFSDRLGQETRVNIAFVDALQRTAGGKSRVVISHRPKPLPRSGAE